MSQWPTANDLYVMCECRKIGEESRKSVVLCSQMMHIKHIFLEDVTQPKFCDFSPQVPHLPRLC